MSTKTTRGYGSIPTSTSFSRAPLPPPSSFMSRDREQISTRRPWREFFEPTSFSLPFDYSETKSRIRRNSNYFRVNYSMVVLLILFLSLIYHPASMIVFLIIFVSWFFLFFFRDDPVALFGRNLDDRLVLAFLLLVTIVALVFTNVGLNVLVSLIVSVVVVGLHAAFRATEDLFLDEHDVVESGLRSVVGGEPTRPTTYTRI